MIDLEYIKKQKTLNNEFGEYSKIYLQTIENINGYMSQIDVENKEILTPTGSGDQTLNGYFYGAQNITCFDINPLSFCQADLKFNAAKNWNI